MSMRQTRVKGTARQLVEELYDAGIRDEAVLRAFIALDREQFVESGFQSRAFENVALPIDCGQTISQPQTVAVMTQAIGPVAGKRVLEIGTGSGFQAAILATLGAIVWSIERHQRLLDQARIRLDRLGLNVGTKVGDGTLGWREYAPYDAILVTAGAPEVPRSLISQLVVGGIMVLPVGSEETQQLMLVRKTSVDEFSEEVLGEARFVPLIGRRGWRDGGS